jgi:hypothetical protein
MTKQEAIKILISDFTSSCIASDWQHLSDTDKEICKALKINIKTENKDG